METKKPSSSSATTDLMVVGCHPDDAEIGLGGTIASMCDKGFNVVLVDLTDGEPTPHGDHETRMKEAAAAAEILGVKDRVTLEMPNREVFDSVESRKQLAAVMREYRPKTVAFPYWEDGHPDHIQGSSIGIGARFYSKIVKWDLPHEPFYPGKMFFYFCVHLNVKMQPSFIMDISGHFDRKLEALKAYHSQFEANEKNRGVYDKVRIDNSYWGQQVGVQYGEPLVTKDYIKLSEPEQLLNA